jgi:hypothetical protein
MFFEKVDAPAPGRKMPNSDWSNHDQYKHATRASTHNHTIAAPKRRNKWPYRICNALSKK